MLGHCRLDWELANICNSKTMRDVNQQTSTSILALGGRRISTWIHRKSTLVGVAQSFGGTKYHHFGHGSIEKRHKMRQLVCSMVQGRAAFFAIQYSWWSMSRIVQIIGVSPVQNAREDTISSPCARLRLALSIRRKCCWEAGKTLDRPRPGFQKSWGARLLTPGGGPTLDHGEPWRNARQNHKDHLYITANNVWSYKYRVHDLLTIGKWWWIIWDTTHQ